MFYRGLLPIGVHTVIALGAGGRRASITFQVVPPGPSGGAVPQGG